MLLLPPPMVLHQNEKRISNRWYDVRESEMVYMLCCVCVAAYLLVNEYLLLYIKQEEAGIWE